MPETLPSEEDAKQTQDLLKSILRDNYRYTNQPNQTTPTYIENLTNEYIPKLFNAIKNHADTQKEQEMLELQQNEDIAKTSVIGRMLQVGDGRGKVLSIQNQRKIEYDRIEKLASDIESIKKDYVTKTFELDAKNLAEKLLYLVPVESADVTQLKRLESIDSLENLILKHISKIESNPDAEDREILDEYKKLLISNNIILNNALEYFGLNPEFMSKYSESQQKELLKIFAEQYAKYMHSQIFKKFYGHSGVEKILIAGVDAVNYLLSDGSPSKEPQLTEDLEFAKIMFFCEHVKDRAYQNADKTAVNTADILRDIEWLNSESLAKWTREAENKVNNTAGVYMLTSEQKTQFIRRQLLIEEKKARSEYYQNTLRLQNFSQNAMDLQTQKAERTLRAEIEAIIDRSVDTYQYKKDPHVSHDYIVNPQTTASATVKNIHGFSELSSEDQLKFTNRLRLANEKIEKYKQTQSWLVYTGSYFYDPQEFVQINARRTQYLERDIPEAIHEKYTNKYQSKIDTYQELYEVRPKDTGHIKSDDLRTQLATELAEGIVNIKKIKKSIPPIPPLDQANPPLTAELLKDSKEALQRIHADTVEKIQIAKALSKIDAFNDLTTVHQLNYIIQIKNCLKEISKATKTNTQSANSPTIAAQKTQIQNLIKEITLNSKVLRDTKAEFGFDDSQTYGDWYAKFKNFFQLPTTQGVIAGAFTGLVAALAAPTISNAVNSYIPGAQAITNAMPATSVATNAVIGLISGAAIGSKVTQIRAIFKPFTYLYNQIAEIMDHTKGNLPDRIFRAGAILTTTAGMAVGIGLAVSSVANPFTGPVIAGIAVGGFATALVAAGAARFAKFVSKKIFEATGVMGESDIYKPTEKLLRMLGDDPSNAKTVNNAQEVSNYFQREIKAFQAKLDSLPQGESIPKIELQNKLAFLKKVWSDLQQGIVSSWEEIPRILYMLEKDKREQEVDAAVAVNIAEITKNLIGLVEMPVSVKKTQLEQTKQEFESIKPKEVSFSQAVKSQKEIMDKSNQEINQLLEINAIIKKRH